MDITPLSLTNEIDFRLREAERIQLTDYWRLETLVDEVLELASHAHLALKAAEALAYKAWARIHLGDSENALRFALDALIMAREHKAKYVEYLALRSLAVAFERGGLPDEAIRLYELQRDIVTALGDKRLQASVLNNIGTAEVTRDPHKASKLFQSALELLPHDNENRVRRVIMSWNATTALALTGRLDEALAYGTEALRLAREIGTRHWAARAQVTLSLVYGLKHEFKAAHAQLAEVQTEVVALQFPVLTGEYHFQLGMVYMEQERIPESVGALEDAYQVMVDNDLVNLQVDVLKQLARCYEMLNDMGGVVSTYKRMTEGIIKQQQRGADLRFAVMKTAFDIDRASIEAQAQAAKLQTSALQKISHEFRTPLAVIKSSAGMVAQYGDRITPEATRARLEEITTQVQWMTLMMDDIAELLQPESGGFPILPFTLNQLIQTSLNDVQTYRLDPRRITVNVNGDATSTLRGTFDALRRTLVQLITNALKFSKGKVYLNLKIESEQLILSIRDMGLGIPPTEQPLVMRPMYRASNIGEINGTGLGLALVDKLTRGASAVVEIVSIVNSGTTVNVAWPLK